MKLRIIAGDFKGRRIEAPEGLQTRPTPDKVRGAVFSMIMDQVYGSIFCDLFAGSGAMGLEALSRGADKCHFAEASREVAQYLIANIEKCKTQDRSVVHRTDYRKALKRIEARGDKVDIFFLDPPYESDLIEKAMADIEELGILADGGQIIVEHDVKRPLPEKIGSYNLYKERTYGRVVISIFLC